jgi:hypothetical protein
MSPSDYNSGLSKELCSIKQDVNVLGMPLNGTLSGLMTQFKQREASVAAVQLQEASTLDLKHSVFKGHKSVISSSQDEIQNTILAQTEKYLQ